VKLVTKDKFGQVGSGSLTLTGPLGVLRLEKEGIPSPSPDDETIVQEQRRILVHWDTKELEQGFGQSGERLVWRYSTYGPSSKGKHVPNALDVFYMPVRYMEFCPEGSEFQWPTLAGLLLQPVGKKRGQYRRVGLFERSGINETNRSCATFWNKTKVLNPGYYTIEHRSGEYDITIV
jgi:hypothetical protein